jgi:hypothetical protein
MQQVIILKENDPNRNHRHRSEQDMATSTGSQLAENIRQSIKELKELCEGVDESTASRANEGRWSPKEILSHLCGPERTGHMPLFQAYLVEENPTVNIDPENPFFSEKRARMTFTELFSEVEREYEGISKFAENLSGAQLDRKARVPQLKDTPLGEYPTLASFLGGLGGYHVQYHIDQMREVLQELTATAR